MHVLLESGGQWLSRHILTKVCTLVACCFNIAAQCSIRKPIRHTRAAECSSYSCSMTRLAHVKVYADHLKLLQEQVQRRSSTRLAASR